MKYGQYQVILMLQYLLLLIDLFMNSFTEIFKISSENVVLLVLFVVQDICIIFGIIVLFLTFFNTFIFQAGLVMLLVKKFKTTIIVTFVYLALSIVLHVHGMTLRWDQPAGYVTQVSFWVLFGIQRMVAVFYYYLYKRTALVLGDPRFFEDSPWIHEEFNKRQ